MAAGPQGDDSQTKTPAKVQNDKKKGRVKLDTVRLELQTQGKDSSAPEPGLSNPKLATTDALMRALDLEIATKDLPRTFWSLLDYLTEKMRKEGKELSFLVDVGAFSKDVRAVVDGELPPPTFRLQPLPARMSIRAILQMALSDFDGGEATYLIRQHRIEITSKKAASTSNLLKQTFATSFDRQPVEFVLDELSELTGISVVIDGRARDRMRIRSRRGFATTCPCSRRCAWSRKARG
jgi:hypothetical protein